MSQGQETTTTTVEQDDQQTDDAVGSAAVGAARSERPHGDSGETSPAGVHDQAVETRSVTGLDVERVPEEIAALTAAVVSWDPPASVPPLLKTAWWWTVHGDGAEDPVVQWTVEWLRSVTGAGPADERVLSKCLQRLVAIDFAEDRSTLRR